MTERLEEARQKIIELPKYFAPVGFMETETNVPLNDVLEIIDSLDTELKDDREKCPKCGGNLFLQPTEGGEGIEWRCVNHACNSTSQTRPATTSDESMREKWAEWRKARVYSPRVPYLGPIYWAWEDAWDAATAHHAEEIKKLRGELASYRADWTEISNMIPFKDEVIKRLRELLNHACETMENQLREYGPDNELSEEIGLIAKALNTTEYEKR
jgi:ssDNA-binding Zn-finger/Zn-ribbon topoisomerase 1